ncbi:H/ACA ribonucleoprotein complex subunit 2-like, partial [Leptosomus discolor]
PERSYREQLDYLNPIAQPLASRKLTRKLYKCIRKGLAGTGARWGAGPGSWRRSPLTLVLAGDTLPIDVYCHIPIMCEDRSLPYAYVPSKS